MNDAGFQTILPAFSDKNAVSVVFASDNNYAIYLEVAVYSLILNASPKNYYDINILGFDISAEQQNRLKSLAASANISIRVFDVNKLIDVEKIKNLQVGYISFATIFRLYISVLFANYSKILYLDVDICIKADIAELYNTNLEGNVLGAVVDEAMIGGERTQKVYDHLYKELTLPIPENYFNAGILLIDIKKFHAVTYPNNDSGNNVLVNDLIKKHYSFLDQDILNIYFNNKTKLMDPAWNFFVVWFRDPKKYQPISEKTKKLITDQKAIKIIHYVSHIKPWVAQDYPLNDYWWEIAKNVPSYKKIKESYNNKIKQCEDDYKNIFKIYLKSRLYHILANLSFGERKTKYKKLKKDCITYIKDIKFTYNLLSQKNK